MQLCVPHNQVACNMALSVLASLMLQGATDAELDEAFYDHFKLSLKRLQVLVAGPGQDWGSAWSSGTSPLHILEPTSLELELKKSLLPNDTRLPKLAFNLLQN